MIVPHYDAVLHGLKTSRKELEGKSSIEIPLSFLKFLLTNVVENGFFNEVGYLAENPDVAAAVRAKKIASGKQHYVSAGFFEGRRGALPKVNEAWYLQMHEDVARAMQSGKLKSASQHFSMVGAEEFRAPSPEYQQEFYDWKVALGKAQRQASKIRANR